MAIAVANILVLLIALEHVWFAVMEIFLWQKPLGLKNFRLSPEQAAQTAVMAKNQGTYNLFLAAGLFWGLAAGGTELGLPLKLFFLGCVTVAGIVGALTVFRSIFWAQAAPAIAALALLLLG
jgi:putative membrane protein